MRYILLTFGILLFQISLINGQDWQWGQQFKSTGNVYPVDIGTDDQSNVYITGRFDSGDLTIGTDLLTLQGDWDIFLSSFATDGTYRWSINIAGTGRDDIGALAIDQNKNIYIVGSFRDDAIYFTPTDSLENSDNFDAFLAAYDSDGNFLYANRIFWGTDTEKLLDITINKTQNKLAVAGNFKAELIYNNGASDVTIAAVGPKDQFVAEYDLSGNFQDISVFTVTKQQTTLTNISVCADGGYFVGGDLRERINFSGTEFLEGDAVNMDAMVFRLDENLNYLWGRLGKGTSFEHVNSSTSDAFSNVYLVGKVQSQPVVFDSTEIYDSSPVYGFGLFDMYAAKYNRSGVLQWIRRIGSTGADNAYGVNLYKNQVQFAGNYSGQIIINQDTLDSGSPTNVNTGFFVYDANGNAVAGEEIIGDVTDYGKNLVISLNGKTLITGEFSSTAIVAGPITLTNTNSPLYDGFLFKYGFAFTASVVNTKQISCNGGSDGELVVLPNYGIPPYAYSWTGPGGFTETNDTISDLSAGVYLVTVTDAVDREVQVSKTVNEPEVITIISSVTDVTCNGSANGTVSLTISGGTVSGDYTYQWSTDDGSGLSQGVKDQVGLSAGTYNLVVTDDNGCIANDSFVITQPLPFSFTGSLVDDVITPPGNNGGINLNVSNAVTPLTYSWTGPGGFSSNAEDLTNLGTGGSYTVVVTDANMCTGDTTFFVNDADAFLVFVSDQKNVSCPGISDGSVTVSTSGGTAPFTYIWRDEFANPVGSNDPTLSDVPAGTYYVRVDDSGVEFYILSVLITEPSTSVQAIVSAINDVNCAGNSDGSIDVIVSDGTLPYTYAWTGPNGYTSSSEDIANLEAGDYTLVVTDANGCTGGLTDLTVSEPSPLVLTVDINSDILCNGEFGGELEANVSGGTEPYSYLWNDQGNQSTKRATTLPAGSYSVIVTDANGCIVQGNESLVEPDQISVSVLKQDVSCNGANDGFISLTVTGGTAPFSYLWTPINEITKDITDLSGGDYTVNITDANNCIWDTTITILESDAILINSVIVTDVTGCFGSDNGSIEIDAIGGAAPLEYSIDDGATWQSSNIFADIGGGTYPISVQDANACLVTDNPVTIVEPEEIVFSTIVTNLSCYGAADGNIEITVASGGIAPFEYSIDGGTTFQAGSSFADLSAGDYDVIVMGSDGCLSPGSTVTVAEPLEIVILSGETTSTCLGESQGTVVVTAEGGTGDLSYILKLNGSEIATNSDGNFTGLDVGTYIVDVIDDNDCGPVSSSPLEVQQSPTYECAIDIYNAFSPNNDGINDRWNIYRIENYPNAVVKVYNNWGTIVFTSTAGYPTPWDGTFNGKALPAGTYYYIIDLDNGEQTKSGTVNIIK